MSIERERCVENARLQATDFGAQMAAAYECDREGLEAEAVTYYDAAWKLGVPDPERSAFLVGYGSTLKNVGRLAESAARLNDAMAYSAVNHPARAFLALTQLRAGDAERAMATMIELLLETGSQESGIIRYRKALTFYADELKSGTRA